MKLLFLLMLLSLNNVFAGTTKVDCELSNYRTEIQNEFLGSLSLDSLPKFFQFSEGDDSKVGHTRKVTFSQTKSNIVLEIREAFKGNRFSTERTFYGKRIINFSSPSKGHQQYRAVLAFGFEKPLSYLSVLSGEEYKKLADLKGCKVSF